MPVKEPGVQLRLATMEDVERVFQWRNDPWIVALGRSGKAVTAAEHKKWFLDTVNGSHRRLFIILKDGQAIGLVRFDRLEVAGCEVSIYLLKAHTGTGLGVVALQQASALIIRQWDVAQIVATIREDNRASRSAFQKAGYRPSPGAATEQIPGYIQVILLPNAYTSRIREFYLPLLQRHGNTPEAVGWGSEGSQQMRFKVLLDIADVTQASVLDVGCGAGHLAGYLRAQGFSGSYVGVDALPEMVKIAQLSFPEWRFEVAEVEEIDDSLRADFVFCSGLFTFGDMQFLQRSVTAMFKHCKKALAFNCLSSRGNQPDASEFQADPETTLAFCKTLTADAVLHHDYAPHDFTIYLHREG